MENTHVIIVAGGSGSRMKSPVPKQFMVLGNRPVLMHTILRFSHALPEAVLILVLPKDQVQSWKDLCVQYNFSIPHTLAEGGANRYASVQNGLKHCPDHGIVAIHDGVRPFVSADCIRRCISKAEEFGSAIPVVPISQSLRKVTASHNSPLSREGIVEVQTPQCFDLAKLKACYLQAYREDFTDDATVFQLAGYTVHLCEGESSNLKITTAADIKLAEALLIAGNL